jgi:hypothetical protein
MKQVPQGIQVKVAQQSPLPHNIQHEHLLEGLIAS